MTNPIRGQRRPGVPSLVLPGDPDGCGCSWKLPAPRVGWCCDGR